MNDMFLDDYYNFLMDELQIDSEVLEAITNIFGYNESNLDDILYYYEGYRDLEQYFEDYPELIEVYPSFQERYGYLLEDDEEDDEEDY